MPDFVWKAGDTGPPLTDVLTLPDGTVPALQGASLTLRLRSLTDAALIVLTGTASIVDVSSGAVRFDPTVADTSITVGNYMAEWVVTKGSSVLTFPADGYRWGRIEPSLATAAQTIVSLADVKEHLRIGSEDLTRDARILGYIATVEPLIEAVTGPIVPKVYDEWHDGGANIIQLIRTPSTGFGTNAVLKILAASEYRGPIEYPLALVASPAFGSIYSVMLNPDMGIITRRTAGGRTLAFMPGRDAIHVFYQSGQSPTPANVAFAAKECVRMIWEWTRQTGTGSRAIADDQEAGPSLEYQLSRMIRILLTPTRRAPSFA